MVPSSATAIDRMLPNRYSSGPSSSPMVTSGTRVASVPQTLPERVRTTVVSPMVSTMVAWVEPEGSASVPQAMRTTVAVAGSRGELRVRMGGPPRWLPSTLWTMDPGGWLCETKIS